MKLDAVLRTMLQAFDRNPVTTSLITSNVGAPPHAETTRLTVAVPAGQSVWLTGWYPIFHRVTAPAPLGRAGFRLYMGAVMIAEAQFVNIAVDAFLNVPIPLNFFAVGPFNITVRTFDTSTGGTVSYYSSGALVLFDS